MTVIYADILLVINLSVDYLLLFAVSRIAGAGFVRIKGFLAAVIGALYSLVIFFELPETVLVLTQIAFVLTMIFVAFGKRKITEFLRLTVIFYICSFVFSGFMVLINSMSKNKPFYVSTGILYFEFSAFQIVISAGAAFIITEILRRLFRHGEAENCILVKILYNGNTAVLKGFVDTGNSLAEPFSGSPVAVVSSESILNILTPKMLSAMENKTLSTDFKYRIVPCNTVSGSVLIPAFRPDSVTVVNETGEYEAEDIMIGISKFAPKNTVIMGKNIILKEKGKFFSEV